MENLLYQAKHRSVINLTDLLKRTEQIGLPSEFQELSLSTSSIRDEKKIVSIAQTIPTSGQHVYYFKVDNPERLKEQFESKDRSKEYKYAKYNSINNEGYLYVGSCSVIKLRDRFIQHCGHKHASTYSLQLSQWLDIEQELNFTFAYAHIDASPDVLQQIEEGLRGILKPIFGKSGPNNKAKF